MAENQKRKAVASAFDGNGEQRDVSYGELVELEDMFNEQVEKFNICFGCEEERQEVLFDFIQQYIDGNDNPQIAYDGNGLQRDVSYGELVELENLFNEQVKKFNIGFECEEERDEALIDFIQQYIDGNDNPQIAYRDNLE